MIDYRAKEANQFIEQQLSTYLKELENDFKSDVLSFSGGLIFGVDDLIRNAIEERKRRNKRGNKRDSLTVSHNGRGLCRGSASYSGYSSLPL